MADEPGDQGLKGGDAEEAAGQVVLLSAPVLVIGRGAGLGAMGGCVVTVGLAGDERISGIFFFGLRAGIAGACVPAACLVAGFAVLLLTGAGLALQVVALHHVLHGVVALAGLDQWGCKEGHVDFAFRVVCD